MNIPTILLTIGGALISSACGFEHKPHSKTSGSLLERPLPCTDYTDAQYAALEAQFDYEKMFKGFTPAHKKRLLKHFYAIPHPYRQVMIEQNKRGTFQGVSHVAMAPSGLAQIGPNGPIFIRLSSSFPTSIEFSFIHEVGHGLTNVIGAVAKLPYQQFADRFEEFMAEGRAYNSSRKGNDPKIRDYSLTSSHEFWADTFHEYYCSPQSHDFLKTKLPKTFSFVSPILEKPVWSNPDGGMGGGGNGGGGSGPVIPNSPSKTFASTLAQLFNERTAECKLELKDLAAGREMSSAEASFALTKKGKLDPEPVKYPFKLSHPLALELGELRFHVSKLDEVNCGS